MKILYLINGLGFSKNSSIGGADKRAVEIIREGNKDKNNSFAVLTTQTGYNIFKEKEDLETTYYVIKQPFWWPDFINNYLIGRVLSYIYSTIYSLFLLPKLKEYDIFFASSDFFFDIFPGFIAKIFLKKKFLCMIHHYIKDPFTRKGNIIINTLMYLSQSFGIWFIGNFSDLIFLYDTDEGRIIRNLLKRRKDKDFFFVQNGINPKLIDQAQEPKEKIYDACFVGGIRYSKGINDFVPIWTKVLEKFPQAKFLIIGGGTKEIVDYLKEKIKTNHLENNIILAGPLSGIDLYTKLKTSKMFLFPSYEEGWGIVICEAMYCKLPIICYNLPAYKIFGEDLNKINPGNWEELANYVIKYLENQTQIEILGEKLKNIAFQFTWENISKKEIQIFKEILSTKVNN
ncbi:MAG: glycosyltransferase [Candidatus Paceibacterota bacterium]